MTLVVKEFHGFHNKFVCYFMDFEQVVLLTKNFSIINVLLKVNSQYMFRVLKQLRNALFVPTGVPVVSVIVVLCCKCLVVMG